MREKGKRKLSTTPSPTRSRRLPAWRARATSLSARRPLLWPRPASSRRHRTRARSQKRPPHSTRPGAARRRASRAPRPSCARRAPSGPATTLHRRTKRSYPWRRPTTARRSRPTRRRGHPHPTRSTELSDHLPITIILCVDSTCLVPLAPDETSARPAPLASQRRRRNPSGYPSSVVFPF